jgi:hypothetical protein
VQAPLVIVGRRSAGLFWNLKQESFLKKLARKEAELTCSCDGFWPMRQFLARRLTRIVNRIAAADHGRTKDQGQLRSRVAVAA